MSEIDLDDWAGRYAALTDPHSGPLGAPALADAGLFLCGISACVDARIDVHDMRPLWEAPKGTPAAELAALLGARIERGIGGEVRFDWPDGPAWLREHLDIRYALGGTGPQAAWVLARLGVPSLIALEDRHAQMLNTIPAGVLLAESGRLKSVDTLQASGPHIPEIFIFEFTAGKQAGPHVAPRSSRVIIRFGDRGIQHDADFEDLSLKLAPTAAAGLLSGLNDEAMSSVATASRHVFDLSRRWMAAGLETVHFELACYASQKAVGEVLAQGSGAVSSIGMSHSELLLMAPSANQPIDAMFALAEKLGLDRVCVHADTWAAAVTRRDPEQEELALMAGCAVASARAAAGGPVQSVTIDRQAGFHPLPFVQREQRGDRFFVACAAPYLEKPATTLGLGDAFTAGCLLVLGRKKHVALYRNLQHA